MPQKRHRPTKQGKQLALSLAGYGAPHVYIAKELGIAKATLEKYYADELATGSDRASALVAESLFKKATGTGPAAVTAAIFWLKARAGWQDRVEVNAVVNAGEEFAKLLQVLTDERESHEPAIIEGRAIRFVDGVQPVGKNTQPAPVRNGGSGA